MGHLRIIYAEITYACALTFPPAFFAVTSYGAYVYL